MSVWLDLQVAKSEQTVEQIVREFVSRFTGSLRDWFQSLDEYTQIRILRFDVHAVTGILFREFLGDVQQYYKRERQEFFEMRCCSLKREDLERHYRRMASRYHSFNGAQDERLEQVYINSFPIEF